MITTITSFIIVEKWLMNWGTSINNIWSHVTHMVTCHTHTVTCHTHGHMSHTRGDPNYLYFSAIRSSISFLIAFPFCTSLFTTTTRNINGTVIRCYIHRLLQLHAVHFCNFKLVCFNEVFPCYWFFRVNSFKTQYAFQFTIYGWRQPEWSMCGKWVAFIPIGGGGWRFV